MLISSPCFFEPANGSSPFHFDRVEYLSTTLNTMIVFHKNTMETNDLHSKEEITPFHFDRAEYLSTTLNNMAGVTWTTTFYLL